MNLLTQFGRKRLIYTLRRATLRKDEDQKIDKMQDYILSIFKKALSFEETELLQEHNLLYIHWNHITIKLSVTEDRVVIMNGKYYYYVFLSKFVADKLRQCFYRKINVRLGHIENRFNNTIIKNLENVLSEMNTAHEAK